MRAPRSRTPLPAPRRSASSQNKRSTTRRRKPTRPWPATDLLVEIEGATQIARGRPAVAPRGHEQILDGATLEAVDQRVVRVQPRAHFHTDDSAQRNCRFGFWNIHHDHAGEV